MGNLRGSILMVIAMAGFAVEDMFVKLSGEAIPAGQILITIGFFGTLAFGALALRRGEPPITAEMLTGVSLLRALSEGMSGAGFIIALTLVPISVVTTIMQVNPLLVTLGAALIFGERVGWRRWTAISVGLAGVLIVLRPFGAGFEAASLFAVMGVLFQTSRDLATRRITGTISTAQLSTLGFVAIIPTGIVALIVAGEAPRLPDARTLAYLVGAIVAAIPALYWIIASMRVGDLSFVAPFRYSRIVFGLSIGVVVFSERLDFYTLLGAAIIVGSGLYGVLREAKLGRARRRASLAASGGV